MSKELKIVGTRVPVFEGYELVTGKAKFTADTRLPNMLYGKILRSPHAHAEIVSMDTSKAEALPGVEAVLTPEDMLAIPERDKHLNNPVRFVGDGVAAVAAVDLETAARALKLIEVEYKTLPVIFDQVEAAKPESLQLWPEGNVIKGWSNPTGPINLEFGDIEAGFQQADAIVERLYNSAQQSHVTQAPKVSVANYEDGRLTVWLHSQGIAEDLDNIAPALNMPQSKLRCIGKYTGGSYGNGTKGPQEVVAAMLAMKTRKPVIVEVDREEDTKCGYAREPVNYHVKLGVKNDGTLTAISTLAYTNVGAYPEDTVTAQLGGERPCTSQYKYQNARYEGYSVNTNLWPSGATRSFGALHFNWGVAQLHDEAAEAIGMDPYDFAMKNGTRTGGLMFQGTTRYPNSSSGIAECLEKAAASMNWQGKWKGWKTPVSVNGSKRRGIGLALMMHSSGTGVSDAIVKMNHDATVNVPMGVGGHGCNASTAMSIIVAETLGIPLESVKPVWGDSDAVPFDTRNYSSRTGHTTGNAYLRAAQDVKRQLIERAAGELEVNIEDLDTEDDIIYVKGDPDKKISYQDIVGEFYAKGVIGTASYAYSDTYSWSGEGMVAKNFGAVVVEVEVDVDTGVITVLGIANGNDCRAINLGVVESQNEGGTMFGMGFALSEHCLGDTHQKEPGGGKYNNSLLNYKIVTIADAPPVDTIITDPGDPIGPYGAKGMAEGVLNAVSPAIGNAVYNAIGVRFIDNPITPKDVLEALGKA